MDEGSLEVHIYIYIYICAKLFNAFAIPAMAGIPNAEKLDWK
jgi:hypothetical protein